MKTHKIGLAGYLFGIFIILSSTIRWWFLYPDISNCLLGISIGGLGCILAYIYNYLRENDERIINLQRQVDTIGGYVTGNADEAIKEEMQGIKQ